MKSKVLLFLLIISNFYPLFVFCQKQDVFKDCDNKNYCEIVFNETFNSVNSKNRWELRSDDKVEREIIQNRGLLINVKSNITLPELTSYKIESDKNFSIETTVEFLSGTKNTSYGIVWGFKDWYNMYYFDISSNGNFQIGAVYKGIKKRLKEWTFSKEIKQNENKNTLKILRNGNEMIFTINRTVVHIDEFYPLNGDFVGFKVFDKKKVLFNNLIIRQDIENNIAQDIENNKSDWKGNGTGFFISKNGYIATNNHVIKDSKEIEIEFLRNGQKQNYTAKIIQVDETNDLAILKIDSPNFKNFNFIPYNFTNQLVDVGTNVFALGYPMALTVMGTEIKFTDGKISSKTGFKGDVSSYQTTTPIQPGNSGGPLFDYSGNLIGINSAILRHDIADNVSYTIKSNYLKNLIEVLPNYIELPNYTVISKEKLTQKIKIISEYVVLIKIK